MVLFCRLISQDLVIKGLCDFIIRSVSSQVIILASLLAMGSVVVGIYFTGRSPFPCHRYSRLEYGFQIRLEKPAVNNFKVYGWQK